MKRVQWLGSAGIAGLVLLLAAGAALAQTATGGAAQVENSSGASSPGTVAGIITDTDKAAIPGAKVVLENLATKTTMDATTDEHGVFSFSSVPPGKYRARVTAKGFSSWKVENIELQANETLTLTPVELGVEALDSRVDAITVEDLAEQQITLEEHQRILGVLPNFYVSYEHNPAPLTRRQKFKLALVVSKDPVTFFTTGVTAGIEQSQNDFSGYGPGIGGYGQRFAATYGDKLSATFLGAAFFPSVFHQDPRYFYKGTGSIPKRALYAISTVVICKGDSGKWQPNFSNVLGNLGSAGISTLYYPQSDQHSVQVTVDNTLIGVATGAIGTLFQEFLLRHLTHGVPQP